jgi:hypothetical protein
MIAPGKAPSGNRHMKSSLLLTLTLLLGVSCLGPRAHLYGRAVIINPGHKHSAHCGHFHHKGRWFHASSHKHGPNCGHHMRTGIWIRL